MPLQIIRQDITCMRVDAVVNPTNEQLVGYSGVDFAVHKAAGEALDAACRALAPLGVGETAVTAGYRLPCRYIIHTVGPTWQDGLHGEMLLLVACYTACLQAAASRGCRSVALPLISAGNGGYPKEQALPLAVQAVSAFLQTCEMDVFLCVFDRESYAFSRALYTDIVAYIGDTDALECARPLLRNRRVVKLSEDAASSDSLTDYIAHTDSSFREMLFALIDGSGMSDVECYKRANIDRRTFSKIKSNPDYRPSKQTAVAFAVALRLDVAQTQALLATLGLTLSHSSVFDKIILYFLLHGNHDIHEINQALFEFDQALLGSF